MRSAITRLDEVMMTVLREELLASTTPDPVLDFAYIQADLGISKATFHRGPRHEVPVVRMSARRFRRAAQRLRSLEDQPAVGRQDRQGGLAMALGEGIAGGVGRPRPADEDGANGSIVASRRPELRVVNGEVTTYKASHIKRPRATKGEMEARAEALIDIVDESKPCTVRQVFYQATVRGIVEKTEAGYDKVQRQLVDLRRDGRIPFSSIADNTRWQRKPLTFDSPTDALERTAAHLPPGALVRPRHLRRGLAREGRAGRRPDAGDASATTSR